MRALILAAGYATRLYPYTKNFPKPLLEVNQKPIIEYLIEKLDKVRGVTEIFVVTNDRFCPYFEKWKKGLKTAKKIHIINDLTRKPEDRLGAIGDMDFVFSRLGFDQDYLVLGGDNFFAEPLSDFVSRARKNTRAVTIGVSDIRNKSEARNYGVALLDRKRKITGFWEKPSKPRSTLVAMCLYYFPRSQVKLIKEYLGNSLHHSDAAGAYIGWLTKNKEVYGVVFKNYWIDIGRVQTYEKVKKMAAIKGEIKK